MKNFIPDNIGTIFFDDNAFDTLFNASAKTFFLILNFIKIPPFIHNYIFV